MNKTLKNNRIAILGLGWLGEALANKIVKKGIEVIGSTTSIEKLKLLSKHFPNSEEIKIETHSIIGNWKVFIENVSILIINIPPRRVKDIEIIYPAQISSIIKNTPKSTKVIFVSSTSVYGPSKITHVEARMTKPNKASGKAVLKAEQLLQSYFGKNLTILRLSGLIGPDRHPGKFLAGKQNLENPKAPINLIHRDDCIGLIEAIIDKDCFGEIFNGCSSIHPLRKPFYERAAKVLNLEKPHFKHAHAVSTIKIIDNSKSKKILDYEYIYDNPEQMFS